VTARIVIDPDLAAATDERNDAGNIAAFDITGHRRVQICESCLIELVGGQGCILKP
jgi:hypothetical protein